MHKMEKLRDNLCEELEKVARKDEINTSDLEVIDKLAHSIKNIDKIMNEGSYEYSGEYPHRNNQNYNRSYGESYNNSYARRGRDGDNDGRYNESRGRSYEYSRDRMTDKLRRMMNETSNDRERDAIMRCISQLEDY